MRKITAFAAVSAALFGLAAGAACAAQITEAQAKEIALKHAGVSAQEARFTKTKLDMDFGRSEYELEFYAGSVEYDYDIDAADGTVRKFSRETHAQPNAAAGSGLIDREKAVEIALARVPGAVLGNVHKLKLDFEDGLQVYEGEIFYNYREYEFKINAATGEVVGWEED